MKLPYADKAVCYGVDFCRQTFLVGIGGLKETTCQNFVVLVIVLQYNSNLLCLEDQFP